MGGGPHGARLQSRTSQTLTDLNLCTRKRSADSDDDWRRARSLARRSRCLAGRASTARPDRNPRKHRSQQLLKKLSHSLSLSLFPLNTQTHSRQRAGESGLADFGLLLATRALYAELVRPHEKATAARDASASLRNPIQADELGVARRRPIYWFAGDARAFARPLARSLSGRRERPLSLGHLFCASIMTDDIDDRGTAAAQHRGDSNSQPPDAPKRGRARPKQLQQGKL